MLKELAGDAALDRFRAEYEKVLRALRKSHDSEKRLIKKCRELNAEIVDGAAKVQAALKLSDEDTATIAALKKEIENSWRVVDSSHEKVWRGLDACLLLLAVQRTLQHDGGTPLLIQSVIKTPVECAM